MEVLSPFERIPAEIVWKIIEYAPDSVLDLRRASQQLNTRVGEYASLKSNQFPIEKLELTLDPNDSLIIFIKITIAEEVFQSRMFRLRLLGFPMNLIRNFKQSWDMQSIVFRDKFDACVDNEILLEFVNVMVGKRIEQVTLTDCCEAPANVLVSNVLRGRVFDKMKVSTSVLDDERIFYLRKAIDVHQVDRLSLSLRRINGSSDAVTVLIDLSTRVSSLHLYQQYDSWIPANSNYLHGVPNADWGLTIIEMFSNKMDKLCIENYSFTEYLRRDCTNMLKLKLPMIGKNIWFEAIRSMQYSNETGDTRYECSIKDACNSLVCNERHVGRTCAHFKTLKIVHESRINEPRDFL